MCVLGAHRQVARRRSAVWAKATAAGADCCCDAGKRLRDFGIASTKVDVVVDLDGWDGLGNRSVAVGFAPRIRGWLVEYRSSVWIRAVGIERVFDVSDAGSLW